MSELDVLYKYKEKMVDELIESKRPWSSDKDKEKAWHIANIVFNSLLSKLLPEEVEAWQKENNIVMKKTKPKVVKS